MSARFSVRGAILCSLLTFVIGITSGILLGYFLSTRVGETIHVRQVNTLRHLVKDGWSDEPNITQRILDGIDAQRIRDNLKFLSSEPHVAGTERDVYLAEYIRDTWREYGLNTVDMVPYETLLSFPDDNKPNTVQVIGGAGKILFTSSAIEVPLRPEEQGKRGISAYHAYSPSGTVEGQLVYANEGVGEDVLFLTQIYDVSLKGKIVLIKEGGSPTGDKIKLLHENGAIGVITFPDPSDVALDGIGPGKVYPHTRSLPGTGVVRSSAGLGRGDPLTPGVPSIKGAFRLTMNETELPKIPSQPISYNDAKLLMSWLGGKLAPPEAWSGPFNSTFYIGPGFSDKSRKKVRLTVNNQYRKATVYNVIGTIKGNIEPDRYVLLGNHRDAWAFGAIDPSSGTAMMLELTRVLGHLVSEGWRPRRTLVFCSWAAEEFGLIGSTEWVEDKLPKLQSRAVAYVNTDICVMGNRLEIMASPILADAIFQVTKLIPDPEENEKSLYDSWIKQKSYLYGDEEEDEEEEPVIVPLGPYSDFAAFLFTAGIPVMDITFRPPLENQTGTAYPMYHTGYETFYLVDKIVDPTFKFHQTCGYVAGLMLHYLADSAVLPFSLHRVSEKLLEEMLTLNRTIFNENLKNAVKEFSIVSATWYENFRKIDRQNPIMVRMFNDQMMKVENSFTSLPLRDPSKTFTRHRVYSALASVYDILREMAFSETEEDRFQREIERHLCDLTVAIHQATEILQTFSTV